MLQMLFNYYYQFAKSWTSETYRECCNFFLSLVHVYHLHAHSYFLFAFTFTCILLDTTAESYLDPTHHTFDRSLLHNYPEWEPIVPNFNYHGRNTYAYLLDKYGYYTEEADGTVEKSLSNAVDTSAKAESEKKLRTFDFVTIQLYEGYSHAEYNTTQLGQSSADYVTYWVSKVLAGWDIDYSADTELKYPYVNKLALDRTELVVGCANGWAGDGKFFLLFPDQVMIFFTSGQWL